MNGPCSHSIYGAPCDPGFDFDRRRAVCRRCGGGVAVDWLPGRWRAYRPDARRTFWVGIAADGGRRVLIEDLGASQSGTRPWVVVQDEADVWQVLEEVREIAPDTIPAPDASASG